MDKVQKHNSFNTNTPSSESRNEPAIGPCISQMNPVQTFLRYFPKISSNIIFPYGFAKNNLYALLIASMRATCPAHHTLIIFGEAYL
jgi:hypothetical protein